MFSSWLPWEEQQQWRLQHLQRPRVTEEVEAAGTALEIRRPFRNRASKNDVRYVSRKSLWHYIPWHEGATLASPSLASIVVRRLMQPPALCLWFWTREVTSGDTGQSLLAAGRGGQWLSLFDHGSRRNKQTGAGAVW